MPATIGSCSVDVADRVDPGATSVIDWTATINNPDSSERAVKYRFAASHPNGEDELDRDIIVISAQSSETVSHSPSYTFPSPSQEIQVDFNAEIMDQAITDDDGTDDDGTDDDGTDGGDLPGADQLTIVSAEFFDFDTRIDVDATIYNPEDQTVTGGLGVWAPKNDHLGLQSKQFEPGEQKNFSVPILKINLDIPDDDGIGVYAAPISGTSATPTESKQRVGTAYPKGSSGDTGDGPSISGSQNLAVLERGEWTIENATVESASWDFGDGNTGSGETVTHEYFSTGNYVIEVSGTTTDGTSFSDTIDVSVTSTTSVQSAHPRDRGL